MISTYLMLISTSTTNAQTYKMFENFLTNYIFSTILCVSIN